MNITEEQKQEADRIVEKYYEYCQGRWVGGINKCERQVLNATHCAIQDRQSVLELARKINTELDFAFGYNLDSEIQSLTNQIDYLKTKI